MFTMLHIVSIVYYSGKFNLKMRTLYSECDVELVAWRKHRSPEGFEAQFIRPPFEYLLFLTFLFSKCCEALQNMESESLPIPSSHSSTPTTSEKNRPDRIGI